jgi:hypothetical protein
MLHFTARVKQAALWLLLILSIPTAVRSQSALSEAGVGDDSNFLIELEAYAKYGGDIDVIDGITGKRYHRANDVVKAINASFPKIMGGLHTMLLVLELKHMEVQMTKGIEHTKKLGDLADSFGVKRFMVEDDSWFLKERRILARLRKEPFFQIKELVVWHRDELSSIGLRGNERAKNLLFNPETLDWERRVLTEWEVNIRTRKSFRRVNKWQGLNLDTNRGFHISDSLPTSISTSSFREVKVSYPIIVYSDRDEQEQIDHLQRMIVKNMSYLYDPFSWGAKRATRFRGRIAGELLKHMEDRSYRVTDREWFDSTICNFLNDVIALEIYGLMEIYDFYVVKRFESSRNLMGEEMDALNWNPGEEREFSKKRTNPKLRFDFNNPTGARFAMLDAYLRYGDVFLDNLRLRLTSLKIKEAGRGIIEESISEVSGVPAKTYIKAALKAQADGIMRFHEQPSG